MKTPVRSLILALGFLTAMSFSVTGHWPPDKISRPGEYNGYVTPIYNEWVRSSQYVMVRDGTMLALDIYRPAINGTAVSTPYPVLLNNTRYHREMAALFFQYKFGRNDGIFDLIRYGYVIAYLDARGSGSSFGSRVEFFSHQENLDTYDVIEWLGRQSWCDGKVGMFGLSYMGITQYMAASLAPPSLKAIMPMMPTYDHYSLFCPGGVFQSSFPAIWGATTKVLDLTTEPVGIIMPATPVGEDADGSMLTAALTQHLGNTWMDEILFSDTFRDTVHPRLGTMPWIDRSPCTYRDQIKASGIPIYHVGGWLDISPKELMLAYHDLGRHSQKLLIGPWYHNEMFDIPEVGEFLKIEHLRWYDYWLKGIDNRIMREQPIYYHTTGAPSGSEWRATAEWPPRKCISVPFYFHAGPTGSVASYNDGGLKMAAVPAGHSSGRDEYNVDYTYSFGPTTRWSNAYAMLPCAYGDMTAQDEKALTYTTAPLPSAVEVTGHPVVHLWVDTTAADGDFFVILEEIDRLGTSHYLTEGVLRATHRAVKPNALYARLGLPYHRSFTGDYLPLTGKPMELVIDLLPLSHVFAKDHRIRVTIACAERETYVTQVVVPMPRVAVYRTREYASFISLPVAHHYKGNCD